MLRLIQVSLVLAGLAVASAIVPAQERSPGRLVFKGATELGEVWVNVGLTGLRLDEAYLPMVVAVVNRSRESAVVDRDAIRLVGPDGLRYPMPTLKELRKNYGRLAIDRRAVSGAGIPWEVWRSERRLSDSNFFPDLSMSRRALVVDQVTLPPGFALIDLAYFAKPPGLGPGVAFLVEVQAEGWEAPVRVGVVLLEHGADSGGAVDGLSGRAVADPRVPSRPPLV